MVYWQVWNLMDNVQNIIDNYYNGMKHSFHMECELCEYFFDQLITKKFGKKHEIFESNGKLGK